VSATPVHDGGPPPPHTVTFGDARLAFSIDEFHRRVARVQEVLAARNLDAALLTRPHNVYWVTGFRSMGAGIAAGMGHIHAALVPSQGDPVVFLRSLETRTARRYAWTEIAPYRDDEDAYAAIAQRLPTGRRRIGVERLDLTALQLGRLCEARPDVDHEDVSMVVDALRRVKSAQELTYVREAARLANLGLAAAIESIRDGARVSTVVAESIRAMYDAGQDDVNWPPVLVWSGPQGGLMHDTALDGTIRVGDLVTIEVTGNAHLYAADAMGTVCVGPPSTEVSTGYETAVALHDAAQSALRAGASGHDIHAMAERVFEAAGSGSYNRRVGGAIGINAQPALFFEGLNLLRGDRSRLEAGMTVLVQPGVDSPGMLIVASTNLVTDSGHEELTRPLRELVAR
jgi:Xaa-Pro dipeptidase